MKKVRRYVGFLVALAIGLNLCVSAAFTDEEQTTKKKAVHTLAALGVVGGYSDGRYQPKKKVTRAEMAKMLFIVNSGGQRKADIYTGVKTPFADIESHWAKAYIAYAYQLGIVAGKSAHSFAPDAMVTGAEAGKMILIMLGYKSERAGLIGKDWLPSTLLLATDAGLLQDFGQDMTEPVTRENAAQLLYNALFAKRVKWTEFGYEKMEITLGEKAMGLKEKTGIVLATGKAGLSTTSVEDGLTLGIMDNAGVLAVTESFTKIVEDYSSFLGQEVTVLYKNKEQIYGIAPSVDTKTMETTVGEIEKLQAGKSFNYKGKEYQMASGMQVYVPDGATNLGPLNQALLNTYPQYQRISFVLKGENTVSLGILSPERLEKVSFVGGEGFAAGKSYTYDTAAAYDDIHVGDYVLATKNYFNEMVNVTKVKTVEGMVYGTRGADALVDNIWYKAGRGLSGDAIVIGNSYQFVVVGEYFFRTTRTQKGMSEKLVFISKALPLNSNNIEGVNYIDAEAFFTNGTKKHIKVSKTEGMPVVASGSYGVAGELAIFGLYSYVIKGNLYELTLYDPVDLEMTMEGTTNGLSTFGERVFNHEDMSLSAKQAFFTNDACVFVVGQDKIAVLTGKQVMEWGETLYNTTADTVNRVFSPRNSRATATLAVLVLAKGNIPVGKTSMKYGYVIEESAYTKIDGQHYAQMTIWNGFETFFVNAVIDDPLDMGDAAYQKGALICYRLAPDVITVTDVDLLKGERHAVTYVNDTGIMLDGFVGAYTKKDGPAIMFIDTEKQEKGGLGNFGDTTTLTIAMKTSFGDHFIKNIYTSGSTGELLYIFVDVNNSFLNSKVAEVDVLTDGSLWATIDQGKKIIELPNGFLGIGFVNNEKVADSANITISGLDYRIINTAGGVETDLTDGDTVEVLAENGDVQTYRITIA